MNAIIGDNGILTQAIKAKELSNISSEREILELKLVETQMDENGKNQAKLGEALSEVSVIKGDWKNVIVGDQIYKDGWYLLEKGDYISEEYGEAKNNWLINYDTGKIIELEEGKYTVASANASGAIVDETLKLNIDPSNMQDQAKWGDNVHYYGGDESEESGIKGTEIKFDGVDDYLKIENVNIDKNNGFTFEFYIEFYGEGALVLGKTKFNEDGTPNKYISAFRMSCGFNALRACLSNYPQCGSDVSEEYIYDGANGHWLRFTDIVMNSGEKNYVSLSVDFENCEIKAYQDGILKKTTTCSKDYLDLCDDLFDLNLPFTVGLQVHNGKPTFSSFDMYACRLYGRILSDEEIKANYVATKSYHDALSGS